MKIDELNQQTMAAYVAVVRNDKQSEATDSQDEGAIKQQAKGDKVELSSYIPIARRSREHREPQAGKIDELKAQIANGTYNVPATAVAQKMVGKMMMEMSNGSSMKGVSMMMQTQ